MISWNSNSENRKGINLYLEKSLKTIQNTSIYKMQTMQNISRQPKTLSSSRGFSKCIFK